METQGTYQVRTTYVRESCFRLFADGWEAPTASEVRQVLQMAGLDPRSAGDFLGVSRRQVNRWTTAEEEIAYSCWVMLCQRAGISYMVSEAN
ncbi:XRE family transcriptional regulator [Pseudomonas sp. RIT-PI-AD]|uniref:XRE family transcriptional regulator n=1 Tax=Pseudomonas sp. RIT-PI-AD TaxID=3035294 RepID=UPI0021DB1006|nr:XRE family transcriptional regulator [Pseudomonas sp. RIT-PI-AD]